MTAIPVAGLVDIMGVSVTLERYGVPSSVDAYGVPVVAAPTLSTVRMAVHQASREQLERAGLDHATDARAFYAKQELRTAGTGGRPDVVSYAGERWELHSVADYQALGGLHMALGVRIE